MTSILLVICGIPASGKTTFAKKIQQRLVDFQFAIVSTDSWRDTEYYSDFKPEKEGIVRKKALERTEHLLDSGRNVIHDDTNYYTSMRHELFTLAQKHNCQWGIIHIDTPIETAQHWNEERQSDIPELVIQRIAQRFDTPGSRYTWDEPVLTVDPTEDDIEKMMEQLRVTITSLPKVAPFERANEDTEAMKRDRITRQVIGQFFATHKEYRGEKKVLVLRHRVLEEAEKEQLTPEETEHRLKQYLENIMAAS